ncbi:hypothetical protein RRG08_012667 [Elysia crispata]|uniref:Uncharacterized protein n=1 Tax=Elysia crispata TaxID=231223 RepID=A0AAE1D1H0_9GAST|nr:hypothetical protein RRG08_012667 [Elysia crispata]
MRQTRGVGGLARQGLSGYSIWQQWRHSSWTWSATRTRGTLIAVYNGAQSADPRQVLGDHLRVTPDPNNRVSLNFDKPGLAPVPVRPAWVFMSGHVYRTVLGGPASRHSGHPRVDTRLLVALKSLGFPHSALVVLQVRAMVVADSGREYGLLQTEDK